MENPLLRELLEHVDQEIKKAETPDAQGQEMLARLSVDIQEIMEVPAESHAQPESFYARLEQAIEHFETSHPALTAHLAQLLAVLSNAGI